MGFNCHKATEPLRGDILFTSKSPEDTVTHLIYLRKMKSQCILSYFYKPLGLYPSPEILSNFLLKPTM